MLITFDLLESHLAEQMPATAYSSQYEESRNGPVIRITPTNSRAAQMSIWAGDTSQCDFSFGSAFFREIDSTDGEDLLKLMDAVIRGGLVEHIWRLGQHELYSKCTLQFRDTRAVIRNGIWLFYPPWLKHTYTYEPFIALKS